MKNFAIYFVDLCSCDPQRFGSERTVISAITRDEARHEFFKQMVANSERAEITDIIELPY